MGSDEQRDNGNGFGGGVHGWGSGARSWRGACEPRRAWERLSRSSNALSQCLPFSVPFFVRRASSPRKGAVDSRTQRGAAGSRRRTPFSAASPTALSRVRSHGRFSTRPHLRFCAVSRQLWCSRNGVNPRCGRCSDIELVRAQSLLLKAAKTRARLPTSDSGQLYHP